MPPADGDPASKRTVAAKPVANAPGRRDDDPSGDDAHDAHDANDANDAFANTIAPQAVRDAAKSPAPTADAPATDATDSNRPTLERAGAAKHALGSDATVAAPSRSPDDRRATPPLPEVPDDHYEPDHEIARGGMGRIVAAQDLRLGRPVALKELLEPSPDQLSRFQREALITARLQHPGIVPVYEAGVWPSGEPFFAMKLVNGRPLDRVIADATTLPQRLALLPRIAAAADAMAYAHSKRIIHRDLKPANVLIGEFGETVVIDWGLAKDLDADDAGIESGTRNERPRVKRANADAAPKAAPKETTSQSSTLTIAGAVMGTPAYMAPEQARGEPVDQRADVFALGAMLYHLLTGSPPYNARTATDVIAAAALGQVTPLLARERRAPPDLVAIVTRAMAPLIADRYPDAGELADELRRFLTGQLVGAHRYTAAQRVGRFIRRHRAAVTIGTIATITIAVGGTLAVKNIVDARDTMERERGLAITRGKAAEHLIDFMISDVKSRLQQIGRVDLLAGLGTEVRRYYDSLAKIPGGIHGDDTDRMAQAIDMVGLAELNSGKPDLAFTMWSDARAQLVASIGTQTGPRSRSRRRMIALFDQELGGIYQQRGKNADAIAAYTNAKHEYDALKDEDATDREVLLGAADTHDRLGDLLRTEGKIDDAYEEYTEARSERERSSGQGNGQPSVEVLALSTSHVKLGSIHQARGESQAALDEYRAALRLRDTLLESQPENTEVQEKVLELQDTMADLERSLGDDNSAVGIYREALPMMAVLVQRDATNTKWKRMRGSLLSDLGFALIDSGAFKDGLDQLSLAIESEQELVSRDEDNAPWAIDLSRTYTRAGDAHVYLGELDAGIAQYELAREIRQRLVDKDPTSVPYRRSLAWGYSKLGNAYILKGELPRAIDAHERALDMRQKLADEAPSQGGFKNELASTEIVLGKLIAAKDPKRSSDMIGAGVARARSLVSADSIDLEWKETLVQGLLAQSDAAKIAGDQKARTPALIEALHVAEAAASRAPQNAHWPGFLGEIHVGLAEVAIAAHDTTAAAAEWKAAREVMEPLAKAGRLPAVRRPLLDRARASR